MLDFNHAPKFADELNAYIDAALVAENATRIAREYLGGSRVGHPCERALQFEFAGAPKDDGADFSGRTLRIFAIGHTLEDLAIHGCAQQGSIFIRARAMTPRASNLVFQSQAGAFVVTSMVSSMPRLNL